MERETPQPTRRGRPRAFDEAAALAAAREVFWDRGFERAALDDLTAAMGISRSSLYAAYGDKHAVLIAAIRLHVDEARRRIERAIAATATPPDAVAAILLQIADVDGGPRGCFFANCIVEFGQRDPEVGRLVEAHLAWLETRLARHLASCGDHVAGRAGDLLALAVGLITLRKAGRPPAELRAALARALHTKS